MSALPGGEAIFRRGLTLAAGCLCVAMLSAQSMAQPARYTPRQLERSPIERLADIPTATVHKRGGALTVAAFGSRLLVLDGDLVLAAADAGQFRGGSVLNAATIAPGAFFVEKSSTDHVVGIGRLTDGCVHVEPRAHRLVHGERCSSGAAFRAECELEPRALGPAAGLVTVTGYLAGATSAKRSPIYP